MKIIDKYLVKQFLQTVLFGLLAFALIFVVIDMMENLDDFIDQDVPYELILNYYLVFIPEIIRLMTPVAVLLAALFTAGKMSNLNELTALRAGGVSLYRFMTPFIITSFIISLSAVYIGGYLVPLANKQKVYIEQKYMRKGLVNIGSNIFFQDTKNRIVTIRYYDVENNQANQVSIQEFDKNDITKLAFRTDAYRMKFDSTKNCWILFNGTSRTFLDTGESFEKFLEKEYYGLNFKPEEIIKKQRKPEEMTLPELDNYAKEQQAT